MHLKMVCENMPSTLPACSSTSHSKLSCSSCRATFSTNSNLKRHLNAKICSEEFVAKKAALSCRKCDKIFNRSDNLQVHENNCKGGEMLSCQNCAMQFKSKFGLIQHRTMCDLYERVGDLFKCPQCSRMFTQLRTVHDHLTRSCKSSTPQDEFMESNVPSTSRQPSKRQQPKEANSDGLFPCPKCSKQFARKWNRDQHFKRMCGVVKSGDSYTLVNQNPQIYSQDLEIIASSFGGLCMTIALPNLQDIKDLPTFLESKKQKVISILQDQLVQKKCLKVSLHVDCVFVKMDGEMTSFNLKTRKKPLYVETNCNQFVENRFQKMLVEKEEATIKNSGWTLAAVDRLLLKVDKFHVLRGSSYIKLPKFLIDRKACINPQNYDDEECAKWAILAAEMNNHPELINNLRTLEKKYNWRGLQYPTKVSDFDKFERDNPNISINVYCLSEENEILPMRVCDDEKEIHRDLLIITNVEEERNHYVLIKNFSRLISSQISKHHGAVFICKRCFTHKYSEAHLQEHKKMCKNYKAAVLDMPVVDDKGQPPKLKFEAWQKTQDVPIAIYADFECYLKPMDPPENAAAATTIKYQEHQPFSYGAFVVSRLPPGAEGDIPLGYHTYRGENAAEHFVQFVRDVSIKTAQLYNKQTPMNLTKDDWRSFHHAQQCYLCEENFTSENYKVRDHCHITGRYRGAAHNTCNLGFKNPSFVPVLLHNLSGYDGHFIVRELGKFEGPINVIPCTSEKYISFAKFLREKMEKNDNVMGDIIMDDIQEEEIPDYFATDVDVEECEPPKKIGEEGKKKEKKGWHIQMRFLDSFRFMASSLDKLAKSMSKEKFINVAANFQQDKFEYVVRKGVFPYDYVDSMDKLDVEYLPTKEEFYSKLYESDISDDEYTYAQTMWELFECKTLGQYSDLYMKIDVLLLADIFENFRDVCMQHYKLDPLWYYTVPGLAWDAALKKTKVVLDLITDDRNLFTVENGIRGGICQVNTRYVEAKNHYVNPEIEESDDNNFIMYDDANNLYGAAMSFKLPVGEYKYLTAEEVPDVQTFDENGEWGLILKADWTVPKKLHKKFNDLPLLAENIVPPGGKFKKLTPNLMDKTEYVCHIAVAKQALAYGLKLTKIHCAVIFKQDDWLRGYIEFNTALRTVSLTDFEKDFFKLMNNAVFGKTMENVRNRKRVEVVCDPKRMKKVIAYPDYQECINIGENLVVVSRLTTKHTMNKPMAVGMSILDLSKTVMYKHHYEVMKPRYGDKVELCYTDTDSFVYNITTRDVYKDRLEMMEHFDTSAYPKDHFLYSEVNKKVVGKMKDEYNGVPVTHFVGLRPKMYGMKILGGKFTKRAKGVKRYAVVKYLTFDDYYKCLDTNTQKIVETSNIRSYRHKVYSERQKKVALSAQDDKRYVKPDGIYTLAWGHKNIPLLPVKRPPPALTPL